MPHFSYAETTLHEGHAAGNDKDVGRSNTTRRNLLILITVLISVFTFGPINPVRACELDENDQCMQMAATDTIAPYAAPMPVVSNSCGATVP